MDVHQNMVQWVLTHPHIDIVHGLENLVAKSNSSVAEHHQKRGISLIGNEVELGIVGVNGDYWAL